MRVIQLIFLLFVTIHSFATEKQTILFASEYTYPPFVYMDANGQHQGFDVDLAKAVCAAINAECLFNHQAFDALIPSLQTGGFDAIHGGISITEERQQQIDFTQAYLFPTASIVAPIAKQLSLTENSLAGKTIGTQQGTTFPYYIAANFPSVTINTYGSMQQAFNDLSVGRIDAVIGETFLIDSWLAEGNNAEQYAAISNPIYDTEFFGEGHGFAVSQGNTALLDELNRGLSLIQHSGQFDEILEKHFGEIKAPDVENFLPLLLTGAWVTFQLAILSLLIGLILGLLMGLGESSRYKVIHYPVFMLTSILRGLPELLLISFVYFGSTYLLQQFFGADVKVNAFIAGVIALSLIFTGYASQVFRAAYQTIPQGQLLASHAHALSPWHTFYRITLPQLWRYALPGLGNLWQVLLKDTALVSLIGVADIMANAQIAANASRQPFTYFLIAAVIYLLLTSLSQLVFNRISHHANKHRVNS